MELRLFLMVFGTVFVAELGDKTQLATMLFAAEAEHSRWVVFCGAAAALVLSSALGVLAGGFISEYVGERVLSWVAGLGFIAIGVFTIARSGAS